VTHLDRSRNRIGAWLDSLQKRMHTNKEQGYCRFGRQDCAYCMGGDDQARRKL
jgi:hypothetical protein